MNNLQKKEDCPVVPQLIDVIAQRSPEQVWMIAPRSADLSQGWQNITFEQLARAVNGMVHWLHGNISLGNSPEIITYMGVQDERYAVVFAAIVKAGHKVMFTSLRNSLEGELNLLDETGCGTILHTEGIDAVVGPIKKARPDINVLQIPSFQELVHAGHVSTASQNSSYDTKGDQSSLILHTSGSTGLPKPVYMKNSTLAMDVTKIAIGSDRKNALSYFYDRKTMFAVAPFFHAIGMITITRTILKEAPLILPPPGRPVNAEVVLNILEMTRPEILLLAPPIIEDLSKKDEGMRALSRSRCLYFGGAPLSREVGDKVNKVIPLLNIIGSTEAWSIPMLVVEDSNDWNYFEFADEGGIILEPQGDSTYEMVFKRRHDIRYQGIFMNFPDIDEWRTRDLFIRHPSKPNLYQFCGRKDDIIVLSNGEKFNPIDLEKSVENHPLVQSALVFGEGRFQAGLLIEPRWAELSDGPDALVDSIWPTVELANKAVANHGNIWKSRILIAKKEKPFQRAAKGSVVRRATNLMYQQEISALYSDEQYSKELGELDLHAGKTQIMAFLRRACKLVLANFDDDVSNDADFFVLGTDSLQILGLASALNNAWRSDDKKIVGPREIYEYSTINSLSDFLATRHSIDHGVQDTVNHQVEIKRLIRELTNDLPTRQQSEKLSFADHKTVLLTGSTGALGSYLLQELTRLKNINRIYTLNRSLDAKTRYVEDCKRDGVHQDLSKIVFLRASFGDSHFGLGDEVYQELLKTVDLVIHNAWAVDFNKGLKTYEKVHLAGIRNFIDFSINSEHRAHIVFISSIAAVGAYGGSEKIPEAIINDPSVPLLHGYGESKYIAERVLGIAAQKSQVPVSIIRAGQLAGPEKGNRMWNQHEWLPSLISTSKAMKMVPKTLGNANTIDWIPLDTAAKIIIELSTIKDEDTNPVSVYNMINPKTTTWSYLLPTIQEHFYFSFESETEKKSTEIPFDQWIDTLAKIPRTSDNAIRYPGLKLVEFYNGLKVDVSQNLQSSNHEDSDTGVGLISMSMSMAVDASVKKSETMKGLREIDSKLMKRWLDQWNF